MQVKGDKGGGCADTGAAGDVGTWRREQGRAAEAGGWWVRATPRWAALHTSRGGEERVKLEGFGDDWLLMGGGL